MTMSMFVPHIWGFSSDDTEMRIARESGWNRTDLVWERLLEESLLNLANGFPKRARIQMKFASLIAGLNFAKNDLRHATCHANFGIMEVERGRFDLAKSHQDKALAIWKFAVCQIEGMVIRPRTRSSLYHMRMEVLHRDQYHQNLRKRIGLIAEEMEQKIKCISTGISSETRHFSRWKGEKPPQFDDSRKILAACLLIIDQ